MSISRDSIGRHSIASGGRPSIPPTQFELENDQNTGPPIIVITELFGSKLIEHFQKYPDELKVMNRRKFEELVAELFDSFGYDVELTQQTRDGGKDIIAIGNMNDIRSKYLIECKRPDPGNPVGVGVVSELFGVKTDERATQAIAVTTTWFTPDAHAFQKKNKWELDLKEYNDLSKWIAAYTRNRG